MEAVVDVVQEVVVLEPHDRVDAEPAVVDELDAGAAVPVVLGAVAVRGGVRRRAVAVVRPHAHGGVVVVAREERGGGGREAQAESEREMAAHRVGSSGRAPCGAGAVGGLHRRIAAPD